MKLIFLDVDGVLNHAGCKIHTPSGYYFVEEDRLQLLCEIIEATGAKVVLSSSWRKGYYDYAAGKKTSDATDYLLLEQKLAECGIEIIGYTPMFDTAYRGSEIAAWIKEHQELDIEAILILDDDKDMKPLSSFLVRTSFFNGLTKKNAARSIEILNSAAFRKFVQQGRLNQSETRGNALHSRVKI